MQRLKILKDTRFATETDFRTATGTLALNLEYYEKMCYSKTWHMKITDIDTDHEWLKTKIISKHIQVPIIPIYWNQRTLTPYEISKAL